MKRMRALIVIGVVLIIGITVLVVAWLRFRRQEKLYEKATKADKEPWGV